MNTHRVCAFLLVLVQAATIAFLSRTYIFPVCIVVCAFIGAVTSLRLKIQREHELRVYVLIAIAFIISYFVFPSPYNIARNFIRTTEAFFLAQGILTAQVVQFFFHRDDNRLSPTLSGFGAVVMICIFSVAVNEFERQVTLGLVVAYIAAAVSFSTSDRGPHAVQGRRHWGQWVASAVIFGVISTFVCTTSVLVYRYAHQLDELLVELTSMHDDRSRVGFSGRARLGNVAHRKSNEPTEIALRIYSPQEPGYLRGKVFEAYNGSNWQAWSESRLLRPVGKSQSKSETSNLFVRHETNDDDENGLAFECWPEVDLQGALVTPWKTEAVRADVSELEVNVHGVFESTAEGTPNWYIAYVPNSETQQSSDLGDLGQQFWKSKNKLNAEWVQRMLKVPDALTNNEEVQALVKTVFANCTTTAEHVQAVEMYFHNNYEYQIGIDVPAGQDPLLFFLTKKPPAHCEYFASGSTMLLRMAGIPCRFVTGFVATEENDYGGYWIARNSDAHAWVEAYDEERGWIIVEPTPSSGQPTPTSRSTWQQLKEYLSAKFREIRSAIQTGTWRQSLLRMVGKLNSPLGWIVLSGSLMFLFRKSIRKLFKQRRKVVHSPEVVELHRLLEKMDRRLARTGIVRQPGETLSRFSQRIASTPPEGEDLADVAQWYRDYARLRFRGEVNRESIDRLSQRI